MNYEEDNYQEQEAPTNINGLFSSSGNNNSQELPPNPFLTNPLDNPLSPNPILESYNQQETPPMSPLPDYIAQNLQSFPEQAPKTYADVNGILGNLQLAEGDPTLYEEDVPFEQLQEGVDYVILKRGETLSSIAAARTELTVEQIRQWNPKAAQNSTKLPVGMRVLISGSAKNMGERVNTTGRIMGAGGQDVNLYQTASTSTPVSTVRYGTHVYIEKTDVSNTWYYVSVDGNKGWVERVFVTTNIPISDPEAELYYVAGGQTLESILQEKNYPSSKETSYWHYGRAASLLNPTAFRFDRAKAQQFIQEQSSSGKGITKLFIDQEIGIQLLYNSMELKSNYHIWLPSTSYTEQAKASGVIESRSELMQGVINAAEGVESFLQGARVGFTGRIEEELAAIKGMVEQLAAFAKDILGSAKAVLMDFWNYIQQFSIEELLKTLLDGLIDPTLKTHLHNAWNSLSSDDTEEKAKLWGLAAGAAVALGAIMVITRGGGKFLKVLKRISPKLGGIFDKKMALTTPDGQRIPVSQKGVLGDGKDGRMKMEGKDGGGRKKPTKTTKIDAVKNLMTKSPDWVKANEELMQKLVGQSESFIAKVDDFYGITMKRTTPVGFKGAGTYNGITYNKYGFPLLKDKNPFGDNYIFKNAKGNHTTDFTDAETWLRDNKNNLGFDDVFVVPGGTRFKVKINGKWSEKMTWHHHENGTDMIPVPSRIHSPELVHSGGVKTVQLGINHLFDY